MNWDLIHFIGINSSIQMIPPSYSSTLFVIVQQNIFHLILGIRKISSQPSTNFQFQFVRLPFFSFLFFIYCIPVCFFFYKDQSNYLARGMYLKQKQKQLKLFSRNGGSLYRCKFDTE